MSITNIDFIVNGHTDIDGYKSDLIKVQLNDPPQKNTELRSFNMIKMAISTIDT